METILFASTLITKGTILQSFLHWKHITWMFDQTILALQHDADGENACYWHESTTIIQQAHTVTHTLIIHKTTAAANSCISH